MSLEQLLADNTAALNRNSDLLEGLTAKAKAGVAASEKADDKPTRAAAEDKPARTRTTKAVKEKDPTIAEMKELATNYLDVADEDEYADRKTVLRAVVEHFGAEKFTSIEKKDRLVAFKLIKMAADGENVDPEDIAGAIDDLDGDLPEADEKPARRRSDDI